MNDKKQALFFSRLVMNKLPPELIHYMLKFFSNNVLYEMWKGGPTALSELVEHWWKISDVTYLASSLMPSGHRPIRMAPLRGYQFVPQLKIGTMIFSMKERFYAISNIEPAMTKVPMHLRALDVVDLDYHIKTLDLAYVDISEEILTNILARKTVRKLLISDCVGFSYFPKELGNLRELYITRHHTALSLTNLAQLKTLNLDRCGLLEDSGISEIVDIPIVSLSDVIDTLFQYTEFISTPRKKPQQSVNIILKGAILQELSEYGVTLNFADVMNIATSVTIQTDFS